MPAHTHRHTDTRYTWWLAA